MPDEPNQFVVLEHITQKGTHWDLMVEDENTLITFRLNISPDKIGTKPIQAQRINDHPLKFLTYEGPVQNNTGEVKRIDKGQCNWKTKEQSLLAADLNGSILKGRLQLTQNSAYPNWSLAFVQRKF